MPEEDIELDEFVEDGITREFIARHAVSMKGVFRKSNKYRYLHSAHAERIRIYTIRRIINNIFLSEAKEDYSLMSRLVEQFCITNEEYKQYDEEAILTSFKEVFDGPYNCKYGIDDGDAYLTFSQRIRIPLVDEYVVKNQDQSYDTRKMDTRIDLDLDEYVEGLKISTNIKIDVKKFYERYQSSLNTNYNLSSNITALMLSSSPMMFLKHLDEWRKLVIEEMSDMSDYFESQNNDIYYNKIGERMFQLDNATIAEICKGRTQKEINSLKERGVISKIATSYFREHGSDITLKIKNGVDAIIASEKKQVKKKVIDNKTIGLGGYQTIPVNFIGHPMGGVPTPDYVQF